MNAIQVLVEDRYGVYIPQAFAKNYPTSAFTNIDQRWTNIDQQDLDILHKGPWDNDLYWEAWESVLNNATYTNQEHTWYLYQNGDLFAICDTMMTNEEYRNFYGEDMWADA